MFGIFRKFALVNKEGTIRVFWIPKQYVPVSIQWELLSYVLRRQFITGGAGGKEMSVSIGSFPILGSFSENIELPRRFGLLYLVEILDVFSRIFSAFSVSPVFSYTRLSCLLAWT